MICIALHCIALHCVALRYVHPEMWAAVVFAGFRNVWYLPELQQCLMQPPEMLIRFPMQYSADQDSFTQLAEEQTSALLESWGFTRTPAAASKGAVLSRTCDLSVTDNK